jgi:ATP-dependent Lon protease
VTAIRVPPDGATPASPGEPSGPEHAAEPVAAVGSVPGRAPVLPLLGAVAFPDMLIPLNVGQPRSVELIQDVLGGDRTLVLIAGRNPEVESPGPTELFEVGVLGVVARMMRVPDGSLRVLVQTGQRVRATSYVQSEPYLIAELAELPDVLTQSKQLEGLARTVQQTFNTIVEEVSYLPQELQIMVANVEDPGALGNLIAGALRLKLEERQELLEETNVTKRLRRLSTILARELEFVQIGSRIQSQVQSELDKGQREFILRQQLKAIRTELGELDEAEAEADELRSQLAAIELPEQARRAADRELERLARLQPAMAEYGVIRTYLEWIATLPWDTTTDDNLNLAHARAVLDADHYDIEQIKDRILEFLAVRSLTAAAGTGPAERAGQVLCFVGPPGVGKTSLGRSIAKALGRRFERLSVGGVRDEAEIRGHRRTYIGALPGTIIRALRDAGARNPLIMIDEIDKMGADFRGDPSSAMLEVLDPEQNAAFRDHYLDLPFDLSEVMFVTTANTLDTIPGPLRDRMEVIQLAGYSDTEKLEIARRYLVPRQIDRNGLTSARIGFSDAGLKAIISGYTREAGVRQLEREIGAACRKVARRVAEGGSGRKLTVTEPRVHELLGPARFRHETRRRTRTPGVATGLAWTPVGGEVLFIEATAMPGTGRLTITGQLGEVMRESAEAALSYIRSNASTLAPALEAGWFAGHDIHIHVPAGATPKDGPSAGVAMVTALVSLITGRPVKGDVAMTGEITLTGQVLPIGGLKEKALAAERSGIKLVIAPALNEPDVVEVSELADTGLRFRFVTTVDEVLEAAIGSRRR